MFFKQITKRAALLPIRDGVILTIRRLDDEGVNAARFCLVDSSNTPFVDPYTKRNAWSRVALNAMLGINNWKPDVTMVKFNERGYSLYEKY